MLKLPFNIYLKYIFYCKKENMGKANDLILHEMSLNPKSQVKTQNSFQFKLVNVKGCCLSNTTPVVFQPPKSCNPLI